MSIIEQSRQNAANAAKAAELDARKAEASKSIDMKGLAQYVADWKDRQQRVREMETVAEAKKYGGMHPALVRPFDGPVKAVDAAGYISERNGTVYPQDVDTARRMEEMRYLQDKYGTINGGYSE